MEGRLTVAIDDAIYTLNRRDDRQDHRRAILYQQMLERHNSVKDDHNQRITRIEDVFLKIMPARVNRLEDVILDDRLRTGVRKGVVEGIKEYESTDDKDE